MSDECVATTLLSSREPGERFRVVRGELVMLDLDVANLYFVPVSKLRRAIRGHLALFGETCAFRLDDPESTPEEFVPRLEPVDFGFVAPQVRVPHLTHAQRKNRPWALTECGIRLLSNILRPEPAPDTTHEILRRFEDRRNWLDSHQLWGFFDESV
jgi:hypothetical protein